MHEKVYQDLKEKGFVSWDKDTDLSALWSHQINRHLKLFLNQQLISFNNLDVLDLGTGTGTCALFCAKEGAKVIGVDISASAIKIAEKNRSLLNLTAEFFVADILLLHFGKKVDLVCESSLLHCLVGNTDRQQFYKIVKQHLKNDGHFFIHTMVKSPDMSSLMNDYFLMEGDILYSLGIAEIVEGRKTFNGKSYFPHRTIKNLSDLKDEINEAGFQIVCSQLVSEKGDPDNFIALLKLK